MAGFLRVHLLFTSIRCLDSRTEKRVALPREGLRAFVAGFLRVHLLFTSIRCLDSRTEKRDCSWTMVIFVLLLVLVSCIYGVWRLSARPPAHRIGWSTISRLAFLIAVLRISALWVGWAGLRRSDWLQIPAYFIVMLGLPDIYMVKAARAEPLRWAILGSLTLAATSFGWSAALLWVVNRLCSKSQGGDLPGVE